MQYQGSILDLDNFPGEILILNNIFEENVVKYDSCDVGRSILDNVVPTGTDKYPNYGTKSTNQIKSLISIVNHKLNLYIQQNTFRHNTGTKGIIYLDMKARVNTRVVIGHNYFYNKD